MDSLRVHVTSLFAVVVFMCADDLSSPWTFLIIRVPRSRTGNLQHIATDSLYPSRHGSEIFVGAEALLFNDI